MIYLFDVGGVVLSADHRITYARLKHYGVPRENAAKFFDNEPYREFSRGRITEKQFYEALRDRYLMHDLALDQVVDAHDAHLFGIDAFVLNIISKIPRDKVAFFTNTNEWQTARERQFVDLRKYSVLIFRSHEIGKLKKDSGSFEYVIRGLEVPPSEIFYVDDDLNNVDMARAFGIRGVQFKNAVQLSKDLESESLNP